MVVAVLAAGQSVHGFDTAWAVAVGCGPVVAVIAVLLAGRHEAPDRRG